MAARAGDGTPAAGLCDAAAAAPPSDLRGAELVRGVIARTDGTIGEMAALLRAAAEAATQGGEEGITAAALDRADYAGPGERRQAIERELT